MPFSSEFVEEGRGLMRVAFGMVDFQDATDLQMTSDERRESRTEADAWVRARVDSRA